MSHTDNLRNHFIILGEGDTVGINGGFDAPETKYIINFSKVKIEFCISLHYDGDNSCLLMEKKYISLRLVIKM